MDNQNTEEEVELLEEPIIKNNVQSDYSNTLGSTSGIDPNFISDLNFNKREEIGILPPNIEKNKSKKPFKAIIVILVVLLSLAFVGFGVYFYLSRANSKAKDKIVPNNLSFDIGTTLSLSPTDYATFKGMSSENCYVDLSAVDTNKAGQYSYSIICGNESYQGTIEIKDVNAPKVETKDIVKTVGAKLKAEEFITKCSDSSNCSVKFKDEELIQSYLAKAGEYEVVLVIEDESGNSTEATAKLSVIEKQIAYYLSCMSNMSFDTDFKYTEYSVDKLAFEENGTFAKILTRTYTYAYFSSADYNEAKTQISDNTFKEHTGTINSNDEKYEINVVVSISGEELDKEGLPNDFTSINNKYLNKEYSCVKE